MSKTPAPPKNFDPVKLESFLEPLFVRVEKKRGGVRTMIPLPAGDDGAPQGANWSKEDVLGLEAWLVTKWSGGGHYVITVTDSTQPTPQKMDWENYYIPGEYPERVPPTLAAAVPEALPQTQQVRQMGSFPSAFANGLPAGTPGPQMVAAPQQPQAAPAQSAPRSNDYAYYAAQAAAQTAAQADADRRRLEDQLRESQALLARQREEMLAAQHRQDLERVRQEQQERMRQEQQAQNDRFSKLEQLIASIAGAKPAVDPAIEALKEQNRILEARAEAERREREAERREREMQEQIRRQAEESRQQIEALRETMQSSNKGLDPVIMMMQELSRQQIEASREAARAAEARMASLQAFMMNPRDVMAMAKESSNGLDSATRSVASAYENIMNLQNRAVENIMQLNNTGGSETIGLIKEGMERAAAFAERYVGGKTKEAVAAQQSQAELAKAQAMTAQAQAAGMQAQVQSQAIAAQVAARQGTATTPGAGVNGTATPHSVTTPIPTPSRPAVIDATAEPKPANDTWSTGPVPPAVADVKARRHRGHTDEEWFGPILPQVQELRAGVARFIESLKQTPHRHLADGRVDGAEPEQAAGAIIQAAMLVQQQQIPINAIIELFGQGRVADFMDVLLPDAPQTYRDDVVQLVMTELQGGGDDDEDEDPDDDSEGEGEVEAAAPPAVAIVKPTPRARA